MYFVRDGGDPSVALDFFSYLLDGELLDTLFPRVENVLLRGPWRGVFTPFGVDGEP